MAALCHRWFTKTKLSYRVPFLKLPPPPCAVLRVIILMTIMLTPILMIIIRIIYIYLIYTQDAGNSSSERLLFRCVPAITSPSEIMLGLFERWVPHAMHCCLWLLYGYYMVSEWLIMGIYGDFHKWGYWTGTPNHHPFVDVIFPQKNHPAIGVPPFMENPISLVELRKGNRWIPQQRTLYVSRFDWAKHEF